MFTQSNRAQKGLFELGVCLPHASCQTPTEVFEDGTRWVQIVWFFLILMKSFAIIKEASH
jgi:hypothetical protein